jgi:sortase A
VIPKIGIDSKVAEVTWRVEEQDGQLVSVWDVADYAAGFHRGSAYPGHIGNIVISGHHNIKGEVFRHVVDLEPDDEVILYVGEVAYRYAVEEKLILPDKHVSAEQKRENGKWIRYFPDERLTLVTCWPYDNNTHRVIVVAKPLLDER